MERFVKNCVIARNLPAGSAGEVTKQSFRERLLRRSLRSLLAMTLVTLFGCASVGIPHYIQDKNPYKQTFYSDFEAVKQVAKAALEDLGWAIEKETDPRLFEHGNSTNADEAHEQVLFFSNIRKSKVSLGIRNTRLNIYLRQVAEHETEVEIRYLAFTTLSFKSFYDYRNDRLVQKIFDSIQNHLN